MIYVIGTSAYGWAIHPFAAMVKKYWGEPVVWYGDTCSEVPENVEFRSVQEVWDWDNDFGRGLKFILEDISEDIVFLSLLDHWLCEPVNVRGVEELRSFMKKDGTVLRGNVTDDDCFQRQDDQELIHVCYCDGFEVLTIPPSDLHCGFYGGLTFTPALWNAKLLYNILEPTWDLWRFEFLGTYKMIKYFPQIKSVGTKPALLYINHAFRHAQRGSVVFDTMNSEDKKEITDMVPSNWYHETTRRKVPVRPVAVREVPKRPIGRIIVPTQEKKPRRVHHKKRKKRKVVRSIPDVLRGDVCVRYIGKETRKFQVMGESHTMYTVKGRGCVFSVKAEDEPGLVRQDDFVQWKR